MTDKITNDSRIYTDIQGLQKLRYETKSNSDAAIKEVSKQFEAMMLQMVLRSMRDANKPMTSDLFGSSDQMDMYQDIYDKQLTLNLSNNGVGLAAMIEKNIRMQQGAHTVSKSATPPTLMPATKPISHTQPALVVENVKPAPPSPAKPNEPQHEIFKTAADFVKKLWPAAKEAASIIGASPQILLAQAALETNWGKKVLAHDSETSSHNLFNIKAGSNWDKKITSKDTLEEEHGVLVKQKANFRSYDSYKASFLDYAQLVKQDSRYNEALSKSDNPHEYMHALQHAGYATDEKYAEKVLNIYNSHAFKDLVSTME